MRCYKFYYSGNGSAPAAANVTIVRNGFIKTINWSVYIDGAGDNDGVRAELSLVPTSNMSVHDSRGDFSCVQSQRNLSTNGAAMGAINENFDLDLQVAAGERIYLNTEVLGAPTVYRVIAYVWVQE